MSARRLLLTVLAMGGIAWALAALTPGHDQLVRALTAPQRTVDSAGPDALVLATAGLLAWAVWAWGALGLALTAASAVPGLLGTAARLGAQVVLPAGARRSAGLLLGLGLGVAGPVAGVTVTVVTAPVAVAAPAPSGGVPDWPGPVASTPSGVATPSPVPDWPADRSPLAEPGSHVVVRGDCLWRIAEARLLDRTGRPPTAGETARAVQAWWTANADVIGPDPDLLLPGQVLRAPEAT